MVDDFTLSALALGIMTVTDSFHFQVLFLILIVILDMGPFWIT